LADSVDTETAEAPNSTEGQDNKREK
jgi:hypothetical protein